MVSKALVAVVAIVAVAAVGVGVYLAMNNGHEPSPLVVDDLRTDLRVGDSIQIKQDASSSIEWSLTDKDASSILSYLYADSDIGEKSSSKTIVYKNKSIVCDCYTTTAKYGSHSTVIDPKTGVVYERTLSHEEGFTEICVLKDTSFDLSLTKEAQEVSSGSFVILVTTFSYAPGCDLTFEYTMTDYDPQDDRGTIDVLRNQTIKTVDDVTISAVLPDDKYQTNVGTFIKTAYLALVHYDYFIKNLDREDQTVSYGTKTTDVIDTVYGKRHVTIQSLKVYKDSELTDDHVIYYGDNGVIYLRTFTNYDSGIAILSGTYYLNGTSLLI